MTHSIRALRVHLAAGPFAILWPWVILVISFIVNFAIFGLLDVPVEARITGGLGSIYAVMLFATMALVTQTFPFMLGLGITRRSYFGGTALHLTGHAAVAGVLLTVLNAIEEATGGWGIDLTFFGPGFVDRESVLAQFLVYAVPFLALSTIGLGLGLIHQRWAARGMYLLSGSLMLLVGAAIVLVGSNDGWPWVGRFFTETDVLTLVAGYPAALTVVLGLTIYLGLRRTTI